MAHEDVPILPSLAVRAVRRMLQVVALGVSFSRGPLMAAAAALFWRPWAKCRPRALPSCWRVGMCR